MKASNFAQFYKSFDLHQVVRECTEIAGILAGEKGVRLFNEVPENSFIYQYRQAVAVIVYNLAMNAMKYTSTGEIRVSAEIFNERIIIRVSDTGSGMPTALVEQLDLADSFYSGGRGRKHRFGYVIIKDLLQLTGGEMKSRKYIEQRHENYHYIEACTGIAFFIIIDAAGQPMSFHTTYRVRDKRKKI